MSGFNVNAKLDKWHDERRLEEKIRVAKDHAVAARKRADSFDEPFRSEIIALAVCVQNAMDALESVLPPKPIC